MDAALAQFLYWNFENISLKIDIASKLGKLFNKHTNLGWFSFLETASKYLNMNNELRRIYVYTLHYKLYTLFILFLYMYIIYTYTGNYKS